MGLFIVNLYFIPSLGILGHRWYDEYVDDKNSNVDGALGKIGQVVNNQKAKNETRRSSIGRYISLWNISAGNIFS